MAKTLWLLLVFILSGCKVIPPSLKVLQAGYSYEQGKYQDAVAGYFKALEYQLQENEIYYNLGVAYSALGEIEPAIEVWDRTLDGGSGNLRAYTLHNQGVAYYQLGRFDLAINLFRESLRLNPSSIDTKINLELALIKKQELQSKNEEKIPAPQNLTEQQNRTLDYLKRNEVFLWGRTQREGEWLEHQDDW